MNSVKTALIGAGHLGTYHAEKLFQIENSQLVAICDPLPEKAQKLAKKYFCQAFSDFKKITKKVDAVLIATPTPLHFELAQFFLKREKHVFLEKPIAQTAKEAEQLCQLAENKNLVLQIGHVERFNPAFIKTKEFLKSSFAEDTQTSMTTGHDKKEDNPHDGHSKNQPPLRVNAKSKKINSKSQEILFIEAKRLAPFKPKNIDVDVILDLMVHDIDLILDLVNSPVVNVLALGTSVMTSHADTANVRLEFESGVVANITASRVAPLKLRELQIFQKLGSLSIDFDSTQVSQFKINTDLTVQRESQIHGELKTKTFEFQDNFTQQKPQTLELPKGDALLVQDRAFIDCIQNSQVPVVSGRQALAVMKVVEQIHEQIYADPV